MPKIIVLGAGRVGRVIARDLSEDRNIEVTVADNRPDYLESLKKKHGFKTLVADLGKKEKVFDAVAGFDLAIGALPGAIGLQAMQAIIAAKKHYVDISFMPEDPRYLDEAADNAGVVVLYDFGVAPGMSNLLIAKGVRELVPANYARCLAGGLPVLRKLPWEYEAPFSPIDVIEEYMRPARFKMGGDIMARLALSHVEHFDIPGVGTLEGFLTDGLRSLLDNINCPNMEEKTLRYPGYAAKIKILRDSGFFNDKEIEVGGHMVNAREFTFKLLEPVWHQEDGSEEFTVVQILVVGGMQRNKRITWTMLDRTDPVKRETSMARTSGFPAAIAARAVLDGTIGLMPGVHPPEALGNNDEFIDNMLQGLTARGINFKRVDQ
jgi:lysine 6-dehydrogenase